MLERRSFEKNVVLTVDFCGKVFFFFGFLEWRMFILKVFVW